MPLHSVYCNAMPTAGMWCSFETRLVLISGPGEPLASKWDWHLLEGSFYSSIYGNIIQPHVDMELCKPRDCVCVCLNGSILLDNMKGSL